MNEKIKLKPCPFCGKQPETYWDSETLEDEYYREGFNIKCCYVHVTAIYKEDAIEKWNNQYFLYKLERV